MYPNLDNNPGSKPSSNQPKKKQGISQEYHSLYSAFKMQLLISKTSSRCNQSNLFSVPIKSFSKWQPSHLPSILSRSKCIYSFTQSFPSQLPSIKTKTLRHQTTLPQTHQLTHRLNQILIASPLDQQNQIYWPTPQDPSRLQHLGNQRRYFHHLRRRLQEQTLTICSRN